MKAEMFPRSFEGENRLTRYSTAKHNIMATKAYDAHDHLARGFHGNRNVPSSLTDETPTWPSSLR